MKNFSLTASLIFHPIIVPLLIVILYFLLQYTFFSPLECYTIIGQVAIVTFFIPICIYYVLRSLGLLKSSIMVSNTKERIIPYVINIFLLLTLNKLVFYNNSAYELNIFFYGLILSYICLLLGSIFKQKYSVHIAILSAGFVFITILLIYQKMPLFILPIILILSIGITATARLYLKAHTSSEIIIGGLIGGLPQLLIWYCYINNYSL